MGALTSKPYAFNARPWELRTVETIDIGDTECVPLRVQLKGNQILRILPLLNNFMKSDWISDRARFGYDGFYNQRLSKISFTNYFVYTAKDNNLLAQLLTFSWDDLLTLLRRYLSINLTKFVFIVQRKLTDQEWKLLDKVTSLRGQSNLIFSQANETNSFSPDLVPFFGLLDANQKFNNADLVITIGLNLRDQFPILYTALRQRFSSTVNFDYYYLMANSINSHDDTDFGVNLGNSISLLWEVLSGKHILSKKILSCQNPLILVGGITVLNHHFFNFMSILYGFVNKIFSLTQSRINIGLLTTDVNYFAAHYYAIGLDDYRYYWSQNNKNIKIIDNNVSENYIQSTTSPLYNNTTTINYIIGLPRIVVHQTFDSQAFDIIVYHSAHYQADRGFTTIDMAFPDLSVFEKTGFYYNVSGISQPSNIVVSSNSDINQKQSNISRFTPADIFLNIWPIGDSKIELYSFDSNIKMDFSEALLACTFLKINSYKSQMFLCSFFGNSITGYDYLLSDDLSVNSPTLNLLKQINIHSQLNFIS